MLQNNGSYQKVVPRKALLRNFKSFVRPDLNMAILFLINLMMNCSKVELKVLNIKHV